MRRRLALILVMVLLASAVPLEVTPAAAYEKKIPCDANENDELTKDELVNAILPYMLGEGDLKLDDVGDAAWVYAYWDGVPKAITDDIEGVLTFHRPIERIVTLNHHIYMPLQTLKATDNVVGVESLWFQEQYKRRTPIIYPNFVDLPQVGSGSTPDYEKILKLQPELIMSNKAAVNKRLKELNLDIAAVSSTTSTTNRTIVVENYRKLGYLLDREEEAEEFIDFYDGLREIIEERVSDIPEEESKPRVYYYYFASWKGTYRTGNTEMIEVAGGNDIFSGVKGHSSIVGVEDIIDRDPEIILAVPCYEYGGYGMDDITKAKELRDEIMSREELQNVTAVKNGKVYIIPADLACCGASGGRHFLGVAYFAKCIYPDLDLDPTALHQEFLTRFQGVDYDLSEHGVFVYHPERFPEGR